MSEIGMVRLYRTASCGIIAADANDDNAPLISVKLSNEARYLTDKGLAQALRDIAKELDAGTIKHPYLKEGGDDE